MLPNEEFVKRKVTLQFIGSVFPSNYCHLVAEGGSSCLRPSSF